MRELRRSYAMGHLPFSYQFTGSVMRPFVLGVDDATGDNIHDRIAFSEGRGHYWLWKNVRFADDEFVSIQQYRRCFWFFPLLGVDTPYAERSLWLHKDPKQSILHFSRREYVEFVQYLGRVDWEPLHEWMWDVDIVVNRPLEYPKSLAQVYGESHRAADWEIFAQICRAHGYDDGRHNWLTGHLMFIMRPDIFEEYMAAWWAVMSEVDGLLAHEDDPYQSRKIGFLSERFMSAWLLKTRMERPSLRIQTLPIAEGLFQFDRTPGEM